MEKQKKEVYLEDISHRTRTSPYSVHRSFFGADAPNALYLHWHPEMEICYLESGELDFTIEDVCYHLCAGEAVFVPPNLLHMAKCAACGAEGEPGVFCAFVFSADLIAVPDRPQVFHKYVQPVLQNPAGFCLQLKETERWQREVLADLKRIFERADREPEAELFFGGMVQVIWQSMYEHYFREKEGNGMWEQLQETFSFIHGHFQEEISLGELAKTAHMSEGQFCRCFKRITGNTPFTYLKRYRLQKCCAYLEGTDKKISEICTLCGFNNISYFNREFLKMMKVKPSVYRARCRKEENANGIQ